MISEKDFDFVVSAKKKWYGLNLKEVYRHRDLIYMFVKRSFTMQYKQTVLGPLWFILNPLISTFISTIVFGNIAGIKSDGIPYFLFYLTGFTLWNYFATCITTTANTFVENANIMGKVYFPRLSMPISAVFFAAINMLVVFAMTLITMAVYRLKGSAIMPNLTLLLIPVYMVQTAALGLGVGIIISSLTTKYRDLSILVGFGVSLWMYLTPVVYPMSTVRGLLGTLIMINPMSPVIQNFKYALLGAGTFELRFWLASLAVTVVIDLLGIMLFNKVEKNFMDTV
ncbi:MAG: ABC transporter permease [Treponema sp.]|nr:ABC transporter permease [Treponema sp.]